MALSDRERDLLEQMEHQFAREDPELVQAMKDDAGFAHRDRRNGRSYNPKYIILGVLLTLTGIIVFFLGVSGKNLIIGVSGFVTVLVGIVVTIPRSGRSGRS